MIELNLAFFVQLVNFGILVFVLNVFLFKPIRKVLGERRQVIEGSRDKADSVDQEVQEKMRQYESKLQHAKADANERKSEALKQAQAEETALLESARNEASDSLGTIRDRVTKEAADASVLLKQQAELLSGEICEKILGRSL